MATQGIEAAPDDCPLKTAAPQVLLALGKQMCLRYTQRRQNTDQYSMTDAWQRVAHL